MYPERKEMITRLVAIGVKATTRNSTAQLEKKWDKYGELTKIHGNAGVRPPKTPRLSTNVEHYNEVAGTAEKKAKNKVRRNKLRKLRKRRGW